MKDHREAVRASNQDHEQGKLFHPSSVSSQSKMKTRTCKAQNTAVVKDINTGKNNWGSGWYAPQKC